MFVLNFGKYKGLTLSEIANKDIDYLSYLILNATEENLKKELKLFVDENESLLLNSKVEMDFDYKLDFEKNEYVVDVPLSLSFYFREMFRNRCIKSKQQGKYVWIISSDLYKEFYQFLEQARTGFFSKAHLLFSSLYIYQSDFHTCNKDIIYNQYYKKF